jgi:polyisoprenoid-binding protein YceI
MKTIATLLSVAGLALAGLVLTSATQPAVPATRAPAADAVTYTVDNVHSSTVFSTMHMGVARFYGRFNKIGGTITVDSAKPANSKVTIEVDMGSVDTNNRDRDEHLRGPDFFDVKQFPMARFESKSVAKDGEKGWKVTGDLTLHGTTKSITIPLEQTGTGKGHEGGTLIGFHGTFTIRRGDYGIDYGAGALGEEVTLILSVEAAAK